jgi:hypothetical protein
MIIVSTLGTVDTRSLEALRNLFRYDDKEMKKIGRRLSEAALVGSMETWRTYRKDMPHTEDARATRMTT